MFINTDLKQSVRNIERKQEEILLKLLDIENKIQHNTDIIVDYFATYRDKKQYKFIEIVKKGNFTKKQLSAIKELADILTEVLNDKEELENNN